ncbi:YbjQ family protein [Magnetovibrio sp.]|uniref:YbjQ family protein n=1 Tax=Magnetovibrio sp. TaxID=2024836 RepID=UPI002F93CA7D
MDNEFLFNIGLVVVPLLLGFVFGQWNEKRHYKSIVRREAELRPLMAFSSRHIPQGIEVGDPHLVIGSAVISVDYFKTFLASLRGIFGGTMSSYETLLERSRREAILRMKQSARDLGADVIFNVRLETCPVFASGGQNTTRSIEVMAYGTALKAPVFRG